MCYILEDDAVEPKTAKGREQAAKETGHKRYGKFKVVKVLAGTAASPTIRIVKTSQEGFHQARNIEDACRIASELEYCPSHVADSRGVGFCILNALGGSEDVFVRNKLLSSWEKRLWHFVMRRWQKNRPNIAIKTPKGVRCTPPENNDQFPIDEGSELLDSEDGKLDPEFNIEVEFEAEEEDEGGVPEEPGLQRKREDDSQDRARKRQRTSYDPRGMLLSWEQQLKRTPSVTRINSADKDEETTVKCCGAIYKKQLVSSQLCRAASCPTQRLAGIDRSHEEHAQGKASDMKRLLPGQWLNDKICP
uniref:Uncharacterized protein n=1 Tax=Branchiostoma floridae TaxID=7739 RepID=C3XRX3_BRAFL|eukprot:XP_002613432.1 hypothetical protein BRAFLDRAFT_84556 [Branchiostoma floridae]